MEIILNNNFSQIDNEYLSLLNGGSNAGKVVLLIGGAIVIGILSPWAAAAVSGILVTGAVVSATSFLATLIGGWCIGATLISASF